MPRARIGTPSEALDIAEGVPIRALGIP